MVGKIKHGRLIIEIPFDLRPRISGTHLIIASSRGPKPIDAMVQGKRVKVLVDAMIAVDSDGTQEERQNRRRRLARTWLTREEFNRLRLI